MPARLLSLTLIAVLLLPACSVETACERYERTGAAGDMDSRDADLEQVQEATEALAECMAEEGDPQ